MTAMLLDRPAPIVDDATRRQFLTGLAAAGLLAGCGSDAAAPDGAPAGNEAFPVRIDHAFGTTEIPAEPQRIVTVGLTDQDAVYALGRQPIASTVWLDDKVILPWSEPGVEGAGPEALAGELNLEAVAAQNPDLILAIYASLTASEYELLSQIAPTVTFPEQYPDGEVPWQEQLRIVARALGRVDRAEELVQQVDQAFVDVKARHPGWEGASAVPAAYFGEGQLYLCSSNSPIGRELATLGFVVPAALDEFANSGENANTVSAERLDLVDHDLVLWASPRDEVETWGIFDVPTFQSLDAVRDGRIVFPSAAVGYAMTFGTVLSIPYLLEQLEPQIAAAIDGDPATEVPS